MVSKYKETEMKHYTEFGNKITDQNIELCKAIVDTGQNLLGSYCAIFANCFTVA